MVAVPEVFGVHWKSRSGALEPLQERDPSTMLPPTVDPVNVPPAAGIGVAAGHVKQLMHCWQIPPAGQPPWKFGGSQISPASVVPFPQRSHRQFARQPSPIDAHAAW